MSNFIWKTIAIRKVEKEKVERNIKKECQLLKFEAFSEYLLKCLTKIGSKFG